MSRTNLRGFHKDFKDGGDTVGRGRGRGLRRLVMVGFIRRAKAEINKSVNFKYK